MKPCLQRVIILQNKLATFWLYSGMREICVDFVFDFKTQRKTDKNDWLYDSCLFYLDLNNGNDNRNWFGCDYF